MYIRLYSSHSNRRNDTHASGNVGHTVKREHTGAFTWHFFYQFSGFIFFSFFSHSVFISSPSLILSSLFYFSPTSDSPPLPPPNSRRYLCVNLQKRTLRKNRHELSLRLA